MRKSLIEVFVGGYADPPFGINRIVFLWDVLHRTNEFCSVDNLLHQMCCLIGTFKLKLVRFRVEEFRMKSLDSSNDTEKEIDVFFS